MITNLYKTLLKAMRFRAVRVLFLYLYYALISATAQVVLLLLVIWDGIRMGNDFLYILKEYNRSELGSRIVNDLMFSDDLPVLINLYDDLLRLDFIEIAFTVIIIIFLPLLGIIWAIPKKSKLSFFYVSLVSLTFYVFIRTLGTIVQNLG